MAWAPNYAGVEELAAYLRIGDSADDVEMNLALAAASRAIDKATHRQFGQVDTPEPRYYTARPDPVRDRWIVATDDLMDDSGLTVAFDTEGDETYTDAITMWALRPVNAAQTGWPWHDLVLRPPDGVAVDDRDAGVRVTARWGWTLVPDPIRQATLLQASRILTRRESPYGIAGSPDAGSEMRLLAKVDPDVEVAVAAYIRDQGMGFA